MSDTDMNDNTNRERSMKPEAQRIAIAEACGTHRVEYHAQDPKFASPCLGTILTDNNGRRKFISDSDEPRREWQHLEFLALPDYLLDLNAMHEAERALDTRHSAGFWEPSTFDRYVNELHNIVAMPETVHATAPQRAEAFLRTLGLWVEGKEAP